MSGWVERKTERAEAITKLLVQAGFGREQILEIFHTCAHVMAPEGLGYDQIGSVYDKQTGRLPVEGTRVTILAYPEHHMDVTMGEVTISNPGEDHFWIRLDDGTEYKMDIGAHPGWMAIKEQI